MTDRLGELSGRLESFVCALICSLPPWASGGATLSSFIEFKKRLCLVAEVCGRGVLRWPGTLRQDGFVC
jgi:hypothetical protein